ncbi:hypothetical protein [Denitrobaculum tricleocarpae]|uniref:Uncharacterized protein n=1 Tax=Denitrobaculum tricleocarpae TaxID=2591009 RepID=A0A545SZ35_9PROT|nr:hypothetical protein [Denitrobaculum tricleocarpae]TQV70236.1 hypothetical protein FKG95_28060 [Denitrobaculum tricleocarpae]
MITLSEFSRSAETARASRLIYEDMAFVAHFSELERISPVADCVTEDRSQPQLEAAGSRCAGGYGRITERLLRIFWPNTPASAK